VGCFLVIVQHTVLLLPVLYMNLRAAIHVQPGNYVWQGNMKIETHGSAFHA
jgi:hypothetical protein